MSIITLANYRTITNTDASDGYDAYITSLIPFVQTSIESYCDRKFDAANYTRWFSYDSTRCLIIPEYPLNTIIFIGSPLVVANISYTTGNNFTIDVKEDRVTVINLNTYGYPSTDYLFSANTTLANLKTEIEDDYPSITVSIVTGYTTMVSSLLRTGNGLTWTGAERIDCNLRLMDGSDRVIKFADDGIFTFNVDLFYYPEKVCLIWNGGYTSATMPKDLQTCMAFIIKDYIGLSESVPGFGLYKSQTITNYSYTLFDQEKLHDIISSYASILDNYRKITI